MKHLVFWLTLPINFFVACFFGLVALGLFIAFAIEAAWNRDGEDE